MRLEHAPLNPKPAYKHLLSPPETKEIGTGGLGSVILHLPGQHRNNQDVEKDTSGFGFESSEIPCKGSPKY